MLTEDFLGLLERNENLLFGEDADSSAYGDNIVYCLFPFSFLVYLENQEEVMSALGDFAEKSGCFLVRVDSFISLCFEEYAVDLADIARFSRHLIQNVMRMSR